MLDGTRAIEYDHHKSDLSRGEAARAWVAIAERAPRDRSRGAPSQRGLQHGGEQ